MAGVVSGVKAKAARHRLGMAALLLTSALGVSVAPPALAQSTALGSQTRTFNIPAGPLTDALVTFGFQSGLQVAADGALTASARSPGVSGSFVPLEALSRLLVGTGLTFRVTSTGTVQLERAPQASSGAIELGPVRVEGAGGATALADMRRTEVPTGPVAGFVASRALTANKTDTPRIETPQSVSVVTADQLRSQSAQSLAGAVRYTPGITAEAFGPDSRGFGLQLRGFVAGDEAFYRDGLSARGTGATAFLTIDPYGAERIEVLRGPTSVLYGGNTPGGLINYVSKRPTDTPLHEIYLEGGTYENFGGGIDLSGPVNEGSTVLYRLTAMGRTGGTFIDHVDRDRIFVAPALTFKPGASTTLTLLAHYQRDDGGFLTQFFPSSGLARPNANGRVPLGTFNGEPDFDRSLVNQYSIGYLFEHRFGDHVTIRQNARYAKLKALTRAVNGSTLQADSRTLNRVASEADQKLDSYVVDTQAQFDFETGPLSHTLLAGVDYKKYVFDLLTDRYTVTPIDMFAPVYGAVPVFSTRSTNSHTNLEQVGIYIQDQIKFDRLSLSIGLRKDWSALKLDNRITSRWTEQDDDAFTVRAGLLYLFDNGIAPYYSYSESFSPITGVNAAGDTFKPETAQQHEAGVKFQPVGTNALFAVSLFDLVRQNLTTRDLANPTFSVQTGEVHSRGLELEATASPAPNWNIQAAYTNLFRVEITRDNTRDAAGNATLEGNRRYGTPRHRFSLWSDYGFSDGALAGFGLGGGIRYVSRSFGDNENTFKVPAATFVDALAYYDWSDIRFAVNGTNIFNKRYTPCTGATQCYFAEGRRVTATVSYRW